MKVTTTKVTDTEVKLVIEADEADLKPSKDRALKKLAREVKLPGFREGKAPLHLVEKNVNPNTLSQEVLEYALDDLYPRAINQENLRPVSQPSVELKKYVPFTELTVELTLQVIGEVKLPDYKKIKMTKPVVKVTAKDVDEVLESLRKRMADKKTVERAAKKDDEVTIDFKGVDEKGKPVNGADAKDYPLTLGTNAFIPGFEDNVIGMKPGEEKTFTLTFPKDYGVQALANKKVVFTVTIKKVQDLELPKLDDDFAKKAGPFKTLDELKSDVKKQLAYEKQAEADRKFENELIQEIASKSKVAIPKILVDEQVARGEEEERRNLTYRGQTWQEHLAEEGVTEEEHRERNRGPAEEQVKASIVLSEIAYNEKIDVTPEEIEIRLQLLKGQYQDKQMQAQLDNPEARRDISARLMTEKTISKLISYVTK